MEYVSDKKGSFGHYIEIEVTTYRRALLTLYEKRDIVLNIEKPRLEQEYMDTVGTFEQEVIKKEIETELLQEKKQMIQVCINRNERIDENLIDNTIAQKREELLKEAVGDEAENSHGLDISGINEEIQEMYTKLVKFFHPEVHSNITEIQRELYNKALEAYRRNDLESMKLIFDMLDDTIEGALSMKNVKEALEFMSSLNLKNNNLVEGDDDEEEVKNYRYDYKLVGEIYKNFKPTDEEIVSQEKLKESKEKMKNLEAELKVIYSEFPFTAKDMLSSKEKIEEYRTQLLHRLREAEAQQEVLGTEIGSMLKREKGVTHEQIRAGSTSTV